MEDYLQYMKSLRSQINDVEDQAAKISVEEQMQLTTIQIMDNDLTSAKSESKQVKEDSEQMMQAKGQICSQILEKQRKIALLESDSSTLSKSLELIHQERISLSATLVDKSTYCTIVAKDIKAKLQQQQDWVDANNISRELCEHELVKDKIDETAGEDNRFLFAVGGNGSIYSHAHLDNLAIKVNSRKNLVVELDSAKAKLDVILQMKSANVMKNSKIKQSIEELKCRANSIKPELRAMDVKNMEEEYKALLSDITGETEYLESLKDQIDKIRGISHVVKCTCGEEYKVGVGLSA